jgi:hypothetical protein
MMNPPPVYEILNEDQIATSSPFYLRLLDSKPSVAVSESSAKKIASTFEEELSKLKRKSFLIAKLTKEFEENGNLVSPSNLLIARAKTMLAIINLSSFVFEDASIEITYNESIFIALRFANDVDLHLQIYLTLLPEEGAESEAFFNYLESGEPVYNGIGTLENVLSDIENIIVFQVA